MTKESRKKRSLILTATLGYGLNMALLSLVGWPGSVSAFSSCLFDTGMYSVFMIAKNISFCGSFFLWFVISLYGSTTLNKLFSHKASYGIFAGIIMLGVTLLMLNPLCHHPAIEGVSGVLLGLGVSGSLTVWQRALCSQETPLDAQSLIYGTMLGAVIFFLLAWMPDWIIRIATVLVIAPVSAVLLARCSLMSPPRTHMVSYPSSQGKLAIRKAMLSLILPALTIGVIGCVMQVVRIAMFWTTESEILLGNLFILALIVGSILIAVFFEVKRYRIDMNVFYRVAAPLIALGLLGAIPLNMLWYQYALSFGLYVAFTIASIMAILACNQVTRHFNLMSFALYSLIFGIIYTIRYMPVFALAPMFNVSIGIAHAYNTAVTVAFGVGGLFAIYVASNGFLHIQKKAHVFTWESELAHEGVSAQEQAWEQWKSFAQKAGLTERECDVALLMREGRSVPYIAEKLCVTQNTVKFHSKNLHVKLGVHSRQELIDVMRENMRL